MNLDKLYEELIPIQKHFNTIITTKEWLDLKSTAAKWQHLLKNFEEKENLYNFFFFVLLLHIQKLVTLTKTDTNFTLTFVKSMKY